ncbi:MAG: carboxypeptidase-like regulatory domain-containing protein [Paludibacter sp.]
MKTLKCYLSKKLVPGCLISLLLISTPILTTFAAPHTDENSEYENHNEYSGVVMDQKTGTALEFANFIVVGTNISIVSNKEGEFILKVPKEILNPTLKISYMGYKDKFIPLANLKFKNSRINMESDQRELPPVSVIAEEQNPYELIQSVLQTKGDNYMDKKTYMKAFYRESIKNDKAYVSLAEAVVEIAKQPYWSMSSDIAKLYKSRKKTNYTELDSVQFKLKGGPNNCLYLDVLKNPDRLFTDDMLSNYTFEFSGVTYNDNKKIYIVNFTPCNSDYNPLYYPNNYSLYHGQLFIDAESQALKSAVFSLDLSDKNKAYSMLIQKTPRHFNVNPIEANYRIDYFEKDGKWYFGYSRIELAFNVSKKKTHYNNNYYTTLEMAVINWEPYTKNNAIMYKDRIKPWVSMSNRISGFSDPDFWGDNNIIEPEKSIQSAIEKIRQELGTQKLTSDATNIQASK